MTVRTYNGNGELYRTYYCVISISKCNYSDKFVLKVEDRFEFVDIKLSACEIKLEVEL